MKAMIILEKIENSFEFLNKMLLLFFAAASLVSGIYWLNHWKSVQGMSLDGWHNVAKCGLSMSIMMFMLCILLVLILLSYIKPAMRKSTSFLVILMVLFAVVLGFALYATYIPSS